jgi:hypothetical protein
MRDVFQSITHNSKLIGLMIWQFLLWIYASSIIAYFYMDHTYFTYRIGDGESMCSSLLHCFFTTLAFGPRSSGSIGDVLLRQSFSNENKSYYYIRYLFDIIFFYGINIIAINMLLAIVIENFAGILSRPKSEEA